MSLQIENMANEKSSRYLKINIADKVLETPIFFPSISSFGLKIPINNLSKIIENISYPRVLVSCYDIYRAKEDNSRRLKFLNKFLIFFYYV